MESGTVSTHHIKEEFEFDHGLSFTLTPTYVAFWDRRCIVPSLSET
jgi:hypothetical protein